MTSMKLFLAILLGLTRGHERFNISLSDGGTPVKFFHFKQTGIYNVEFNFKAWINPKYDPHGIILDNIFTMRFLYVCITNPYGGRDYIPFIESTLQIKRDKWLLWAGTEIYLVYRVQKDVTEFFIPGFLASTTIRSVQLINRLTVSVSLRSR